jgi:glycosyltransferase EpsD
VKVVYTAHGFHFFKGAPFYYWCLFYPVEKWFSKYLDCLITINREDFELAVKNFSCKKVRRISGMGVDPHRFDTIGTTERSEVRKSLNIPEDAFVLIYVAEFIKRKNHAFLINAATKLKELIPSLHIILPGRGVLWNNIKEMVAEQKIDHFVHLLGFRDDINKVLGCSDVAISTSKQEGLGLHLVEAMMCGLPAVASQDRGHREIVIHGDNGFLYGQNNTDEFIRYVKTLYDDAELRDRVSKNARLNAKKFELSKSINEIKSIYEEVIDTKLCLFKNR